MSLKFLQGFAVAGPSLTRPGSGGPRSFSAPARAPWGERAGYTANDADDSANTKLRVACNSQVRMPKRISQRGLLARCCEWGQRGSGWYQHILYTTLGTKRPSAVTFMLSAAGVAIRHCGDAASAPSPKR